MLVKDGVTVDSIAGGTAIPDLNAALQRVAENILDSRTAPKEARKITFTVTVKPTEARDIAAITLGMKVKLAEPKPASTMVFVNQTRDGEVFLSERDGRQPEMFEGETPAPPAPKHIDQQRRAAADSDD